MEKWQACSQQLVSSRAGVEPASDHTAGLPKGSDCRLFTAATRAVWISVGKKSSDVSSIFRFSCVTTLTTANFKVPMSVPPLVDERLRMLLAATSAPRKTSDSGSHF